MKTEQRHLPGIVSIVVGKMAAVTGAAAIDIHTAEKPQKCL